MYHNHNQTHWTCTVRFRFTFMLLFNCSSSCSCLWPCSSSWICTRRCLRRHIDEHVRSGSCSHSCSCQVKGNFLFFMSMILSIIMFMSVSMLIHCKNSTALLSQIWKWRCCIRIRVVFFSHRYLTNVVATASFPFLGGKRVFLFLQCIRVQSHIHVLVHAHANLHAPAHDDVHVNVNKSMLKTFFRALGL
jgi:hypothetical protein